MQADVTSQEIPAEKARRVFFFGTESEDGQWEGSCEDSDGEGTTPSRRWLAFPL
jgi:hypothetical protein